MTAAATLPRHMASWGESLDSQRSALRWDIKRTIKSLCMKLSDIGEECYVITANPSNGWVGHMGSVRGDEFLEDKPDLPYDFLAYCQGVMSDSASEHTATTEESESEMSDQTFARELKDRRPRRKRRTRGGSCSPTYGSSLASSEEEEEEERTKSCVTIKNVAKNISLDIPSSQYSLQQTRQTLCLFRRRKSKSGLSQNNQTMKAVTFKRFTCPTCCRTFKHGRLFRNHMKDPMHIAQVNLPIFCYKCYEAFPHRYLLNSHILQCKAQSVKQLVRKERRKGIPRKVHV